MIEIKVPGISCTVEVCGNEKRFDFEYCEMYDPPSLSYQLLRSWAEHFGTEKIDTSDNIRQSGCETCDYGSKYGFRVIIEGATKNNPYTEVTS